MSGRISRAKSLQYGTADAALFRLAGKLFAAKNDRDIVPTSATTSLDSTIGLASDETVGDALPPFVVGSENHLVRQALTELHARRTRFNPIVFFGPTGFGKSLLLRHACDLHTDSESLYIAASDFARDYATALELESLDEFRDRFRQPDFVAIDDVQQIAGKDAAQLEVCSLVDHLVSTGKQLVVASKVTIEKCEKLLPQLASRLLAGLSVPVAAPSRADCIEILRFLAPRFNITLDDATIDYLATVASTQTTKAPAPYVNHLLSQLVAESEAHNQPVSLALAKSLFDSNDDFEPSLSAITTAVAKRFRLTSRDIRSSSRKQPIVRARGIAMLLARSFTTNSLDEIGKHFGNRDHTTVLHACRRASTLLRDDSDLQTHWRELRSSIHS